MNIARMRDSYFWLQALSLCTSPVNPDNPSKVVLVVQRVAVRKEKEPFGAVAFRLWLRIQKGLVPGVADLQEGPGITLIVALEKMAAIE